MAPPGIIHAGARLVADCTGDSQQRANCVSTLLHELAHEYQRSMPQWAMEGGAEAFSRTFDVRVKQRIGVAPIHWAYGSWVRRVIRERGVRWVMSLQFVSIRHV